MNPFILVNDVENAEEKLRGTPRVPTHVTWFEIIPILGTTWRRV